MKVASSREKPSRESEFDELVRRIRAEPTLTIKDFDLGATLGTGTFGRVRQVRFKHSNSKVAFALKMLKKTEIVKLSQVEHIKSEKFILSQIDHPFIVKLVCCFQNAKYVYMLFEFLSGGEVFRRLRKEGRFSEDVALFYAVEILLAIRYLHTNEIVYRDLKPENLLLDNSGHVKLADFGFAKVVAKNRTFTLCGTPEYLAPEIIKGQKAGYGKSVDWWALGILLYEMLVGCVKKLSALLRQKAAGNLQEDLEGHNRVSALSFAADQRPDSQVVKSRLPTPSRRQRCLLSRTARRL